jgi:hypothetical protein
VKKQRPNYRRLKKLRNYTVHEISGVLGIHKNTVRHWINDGLQTTDKKRPLLVRGRDLIGFLQARRSRRRRLCGKAQMYCFRCRSAKDPAGAMADYCPLTEKLGNLTGICPDCGLIMHRVIGLTNLRSICAEIEITFPRAVARLTDIAQPSLSSDLRGDA